MRHSSIFKYCAAFLAAGLSAAAMAATSPPATGTVSSPLDLSQVPSIYAQKGIAPNLFLLLDDSGSMQFESLGTNTDFITNIYYGYPVGSPYPYCSSSSRSCGNYTQTVPAFGASNVYAGQFRSAYVNPNYYNPSATYTPWACAAPYPESSDQTDAVSPLSGFSCHWDTNVDLWVMNDANPAAAYLNPAKTSAGFRDIEVWNDSTDNSNETASNGYAGASSGYRGGDPTWVTASSSCSASNYGGYRCSNTTSGNLAFWPATYFNYFGPQPGTASDYGNIANYQRVQICPATATTNSNGVASNGTDGSGNPICSPPPVLPASPLAYHTYVDGSGNYVYIEADGTQVSRTPAEELQNFANWYQYYRSHILMADGGIGIAFMQLPNGFRVDYDTINDADNGITSTNIPIQSTEDFLQDSTHSQRLNFLQTLYTQQIDQNGTPSRLALDSVGQWFSGAPSSAAPWGTSAAEQTESGESYLSCRSNYTVFMTDGMWNGNSPGVGNQDDTNGNTITDPNGNTFQYTPQPPYADTYSDTLADVAMNYWKNDIQTGMSNDVPVNSSDAAFWQHMDTFTVGLGVMPTLVSQYMANNPGVSEGGAQQAVFQALAAGTQSWPQPASNSANNIDDLWHAAVDGHGTFASAQDPAQLYQALSSALIAIVDRSAAASSLAVNTEKAGQTRTSLQVFQALFHPQYWSGDVLALPVMVTGAPNSATATVSLGTDANWSASCVLTGGACSAMGTNASGQATHTISVESPSSRQIITWNDKTGQGAAFEWNSLSSTQKSDLSGQTTLNYLRGDRTGEELNGGKLRTRSSVLGDIVRSSPTFVGAPNSDYPDTWNNLLYPSESNPEDANGATAYSAFEANEADRENIVYVGANDGMLHAFRAGTTTDTSTNDGQEVFAYVPNAVMSDLKLYTEPTYTHHYYANESPGVGDLFYGGGWHTWLVSGEGAGGNSIFALDITNPTSTNFSESNASNVVIGEWGPGNISCVNVSNCGNDLGETFGVPVITRFNDNEWGFVFGNGYNSASGVASIFIGLVSPKTGAVTFYELQTGYGADNDPSGQHRPDGIAYVTPVDLNDDHTVDYIYAGDYFGNVWRFNVTSDSPSDWTASYNGSAGQPLFTAANGSPGFGDGTAQPITTKLVVVAVPSQSGLPRVMVEFGTGTDVTTTDQAPNTTAGGVQSLYGVWDWDFSGWNSGHPESGVTTSTPVAFQYADLASTGAPAGTLTRSELQQQTIDDEVTTTTLAGGANSNRVTSQNQVCWENTTTCSAGNDKYGWFMDLVSPNTALGNNGMQGEKVIYNPTLRNGVFIVNTTIPSTQSGLTCGATGNTGWTMALDPETGGRLAFEPFDTRGNGNFDQVTVNGQNTNTSGIALGAVGSPSFVTYGTKTYLVVNTSGGQAKIEKTNLGTGRLTVQLTWQELR